MSHPSPAPTLVAEAHHGQHENPAPPSPKHNFASTPVNDTAGAESMTPTLTTSTGDLEKAHTKVYEGDGSEERPFIVRWQEGDRANPFNWSKTARWAIVATQAMCTFVIAFGSSTYAGGIAQMIVYFDVSAEVITLGLSL